MMNLRTLCGAVVLGIAAAIGGASACAGQVDLYVGGSYTGQDVLNYTYKGSYDGGGGSIDVSSINGVAVPFLYCVDIPDSVNVSADYRNTLVTSDARVWLGSDTSNIGTIENAGSVAYLLAKYGAEASAYAQSHGGSRAAEGGLQAAIWQVIYGKDFAIDPSCAAYSFYSTYYADVTGGNSDPSSWKQAGLGHVLWLSPSNDPSISLDHAPDRVYQALITAAVPEPASLVAGCTGALALAGFGLLRRRGA
ncbi:hypothetical protein OJF2_62410 [Aquisphaera giovannonii]|uniref:PEP-CTERM protein-sorting domain-containing protein n=1 Tax=Aquisphaera giovannonii TaxID=406548 RepID=A0A5B9WCP4_9BACT|nr:hypothetical protein [Aquisphaera giovannonii]QEH37650.1 hypothetical protein OJF2_62410 [Aquisphaera giovannonii]